LDKRKPREGGSRGSGGGRIGVERRSGLDAGAEARAIEGSENGGAEGARARTRAVARINTADLAHGRTFQSPALP